MVLPILIGILCDDKIHIPFPQIWVRPEMNLMREALL
jgi:hypothetical protein